MNIQDIFTKMQQGYKLVFIPYSKQGCRDCINRGPALNCRQCKKHIPITSPVSLKLLSGCKDALYIGKTIYKKNANMQLVASGGDARNIYHAVNDTYKGVVDSNITACWIGGFHEHISIAEYQ